MNPVVEPLPGLHAARRRSAVMRLALLVVIGLAICVGGIFLLRQQGNAPANGYYGEPIGKDAPDFALTAQDGKTMSLGDLKGNVVLMTFGFTHCPNICPTTLANLAAICQALPPRDRQRVKVLFITVDPARDTPKALGDYVSFYNKDFIGLTGSDAQIAKVAKDYGAYYEAVMQQSQVAGDYYTMNHSTYVYLIDPKGSYALLYDNDKLTDHDRMAQDIERELGN